MSTGAPGAGGPEASPRVFASRPCLIERRSRVSGVVSCSSGWWGSPFFPLTTGDEDLIFFSADLEVIPLPASSDQPEGSTDMIQADIGANHSEESVKQRPDEVLTGPVWPSPRIFRKVCDVLAFFPTTDMFGAQISHQVPRYFSEDETDMDAAGTDVFSTD